MRRSYDGPDSMVKPPLLTSAFLLAAAYALSSATGLAISVLLARAMGSELFGTWALIGHLATTALTIARCGRDQTMLRDLAQAAPGQRGGVFATALRSSVRLALFVYPAALLIGVLAFHLPLAATGLGMLGIVLGILDAQAWYDVHNASTRHALIGSATRILLLGLIAAVAGLAAQPDHLLLGAAAALAASTIAGLLVQFAWARRQLALPRRETAAAEWPNGVQLRYLSISGMALMYGPVLGMILAALQSRSAVAYFSIAASVFGIFLTGVQQIGRLHSGEISINAASASIDLPGLKALVRKQALLTAALSLPTALAVLTLGPWALQLAFGDELARGAFPVLAILTGLMFIAPVTASGGLLVRALGCDRAAVIIYGSGTALCLLSAAIYVPRHGAIGAAISYVVGVAFIWIAQLVHSVRVIRARRLPPPSPSDSHTGRS